MIPKVIHYCWFGGNTKPASVLKCIESWKKYCPDYEIREWNEENFPVGDNLYCKQAYEAKKWAFATDYARLVIVYNNGGIYLDTDVEVIKPDGTVIKAKSIESHDDLDKIVNKEAKMAKPVEVVKTEPAKQEKAPVAVARPVETPKAQPQETKKAEPQGINGAFVIQAGSFKGKSLAETQCKKILAKVSFGDKKCGIAHGSNSYRTIIYPFKTNNEASAFANKVQKSTKISCLVKRNVSR